MNVTLSDFAPFLSWMRRYRRRQGDRPADLIRQGRRLPVKLPHEPDLEFFKAPFTY